MERDLFSFCLLALITLSRYLDDESYYLPLLLLLGFSGAVYFRERRRRERIDFINQLKSHRRDLRTGGAVTVNNLVLRYHSRLATYYVSVGGLLASVQIPSQFHLASTENHPVAVLYSIISLISGWWSVPHGPFETIRCLLHNWDGGEKTTVAMLIDEPLLRRLDKQREKLQNRPAPKAPPSSSQNISTGAGSPSGAQLEKRTRFEAPLSLEERLQALHHPTPPGAKLAAKTRAAWDRKKETLFQILTGQLKRRPKNEGPDRR